jgi:hypothetical protein
VQLDAQRQVEATLCRRSDQRPKLDPTQGSAYKGRRARASATCAVGR